MCSSDLKSKDYRTKQEAWENIPTTIDKQVQPLEIETDAAEYEIYREGNPADKDEKIIGINTLTRQENAITKATFMRNYYSKSKNSE